MEKPWFPASLSSVIDADILEAGTEAKLMDSMVCELQLARSIQNLADAISKSK